MPRLFVGIELPPLVRDRVALLAGGIPGARWEPAEKLHLTLRFLGEIEGSTLRAVIDALDGVRAAPFSVTLQGMGHFPPRGEPHSVWVGVEDPTDLIDLHRRIDRALVRVGLEPDRRKFAPHVTLARLRASPSRKVAEFLTHHALFRADPFDVEAFALFSSVRGPNGSKYTVERTFDLRP